MLCKVLLALVFVAGAAALADDAQPAHRYNGTAPVDLGRGIPFNNGTWGNRNEAYEAQSTSGYLAPGVRATPYTYDQRERFITNVKALYPIYEDAIQNLKTNKDQRPEVKTYREEMLKNLEARLEASQDATKKADHANENEWPAAQENARKAFSELQALLVRNNTHY